MANAESRLNASGSASTTKGRGKLNNLSSKSNGLTQKLDVLTSGGAQLKKRPDLNESLIVQIIGDGGPKASVSSNRIITRSGRIIKKTKDNLKAMNNILKNELLIEDKLKHKRASKVSAKNGLNNNSIEIVDQNSENILEQIKYSNGKRREIKAETKSSKQTVRATNKKLSKENNKICNGTNSENNGNDNSNNEPLNLSSLDVEIGPDNHIVITENFDDVSIVNVPAEANATEVMDQESRQDVLNQMKSVMSPDEQNKAETNHSLKRKFKGKPKENGRNTPKKRKNQDPDPKTKQVTLSNGVVLRLSFLQCDHCQKSFVSKASLSRHMLTHIDLRRYRCPHCPRKFRYQTTLKIHIQKKHPGIVKKPEHHLCQICDKTFLMKENLELHLATHVKAESKNFKCLYCDQKFSYRLLMIQHEKTHLVKGRFKCYICEMSFQSRSRLKHHIQTHTNVKEYICQYCGKEFLRLNYIKRHVQVCHTGHRIKCPICFKELRGHLTEHMRVHEQKRPHICPDCGQAFTQSTQLTVHRRSHTGARPYPCKICKRPFGHSNALMLHIRRHTGEKPFTCAMCPMTFSQLPHMKAHMNKIHGKMYIYKCQKCEEYFKLKADLDAHTKTCTVGDKELSFEEKIQASIRCDDVEVESASSLSKMRFRLALLLTMIASKGKLKYLGFNKRLIDDLLVDSLEAMGQTPCDDVTLSPLKRLKTNIEILLQKTIPKVQMKKFKRENKTMEEILVLLTDEKNNNEKNVQ